MAQQKPEPAVIYHRLPTLNVHPITKGELDQLRSRDPSTILGGVATFTLGAAMNGLFAVLTVPKPDPLTAAYIVLLASTVVLLIIGIVAGVVACLLPNTKVKLIDEICRRDLPLGEGAGTQMSDKGGSQKLPPAAPNGKVTG